MYLPAPWLIPRVLSVVGEDWKTNLIKQVGIKLSKILKVRARAGTLFGEW